MSSSPSAARAARRRVAWQQATAAKRRRQRTTALTGIAVVIALFAALVIAKAADRGTAPAPVAATTATAAQVVQQATHVPASVFTAIGTGGTGGATAQAQPITGGAPLTAGGKPEVLYLGAEYCPYCAAERWPLVLALSRFGTFTGLALTESTGSDVYPNTNTFTFLNAHYTSAYLTFTSVELYDRADNPLQTPTAAQQQLLTDYGQGGIPFIDLGGKSMLRSSGYSPQTLAGLDWTQIADKLTGDTASPVTRAIVGTANRITANLCGLTGNQPAPVCTAPEVKALEANS